MLFTYLPPAHGLFGTAPLGLGAWLRIGAFGAALFLLVELEKMCWRARTHSAAQVEERPASDVPVGRT
jgi:hypothetical protein